MAAQSGINPGRVRNLIIEIEKKKAELMNLADESAKLMGELSKVYEGQASSATVLNVVLTSKEVEDYVDAIIKSLKKNAGMQVEDYKRQDAKNADSVSTPASSN